MGKVMDKKIIDTELLAGGPVNREGRGRAQRGNRLMCASLAIAVTVTVAYN